ncbi:MAG: hypothetical protein HY815_24765 [Candidatus Riflebacteria bacterium]|nr:hypothetical protein [Candidatus Riflebacteria bacterium]
MPDLPYQYVTAHVYVTVHPNGIEWLDKGVVSNSPKEFIPASEIAEVVEETGGLVSPARLEVRFKHRPSRSISAPLGSRATLHELREAIVSILK